MIHFYSGSGSMQCLKNSPIASLFGLIINMIASGLIAGGLGYIRRYIYDVLKPHESIWPWIDVVGYCVGATYFLYSIYCYIVNACSHGQNARHFFDSNSRISGMKCIILFTLFLNGLTIILWACASCCLAYFLINVGMLEERRNMLNLNVTMKHDLSFYGLYDVYGNAISITNENFYRNTKNLIICSCISLGGGLLYILGFFQLSICAAINYSRLNELRYNCDSNRYSNHPFAPKYVGSSSMDNSSRQNSVVLRQL